MLSIHPSLFFFSPSFFLFFACSASRLLADNSFHHLAFDHLKFFVTCSPANSLRKATAICLNFATSILLIANKTINNANNNVNISEYGINHVSSICSSCFSFCLFYFSYSAFFLPFSSFYAQLQKVHLKCGSS